MPIKKNLVASYANQLYSSLIGILILPIYIDHMGAEAYGLVGFFTMLTAWFTLLDMGLTPTVMRESARFKGGRATVVEYLLLVRSFAALFLLIAVAIFLSIVFSSTSIASEWLHLETLSVEQVSFCISIMGAIIALRWAGGLLRGVINGAEKIVLLSISNSGFSTLRFVVVLPIIIFVDAEPVSYFSYQLAVAVCEFFTLLAFASRVLPRNGNRYWFVGSFSVTPIKLSLKFALSIAFTSIVWVAITQTDKLILSNLMTLSDYGYYSLAVLAASGVLVLSGPIGSVIMPRLANLEAQGDEVGFIRLYRTATQLAAVASSSLAFVLFFFSEELLWVWTGNQDVVDNASSVLGLYALGNGVLVVAAFPYYMQFAKGDMKMHVYGNILFLIVLLPLIIWAAQSYGAVGAAAVWLGSNLALFMFWLPWVHRRFIRGLNRIWYSSDTTIIFSAAGFFSLIMASLDLQIVNRFKMLAVLVAIGCLVLILAVASSSKAREYLIARVNKSRLEHAK